MSKIKGTVTRAQKSKFGFFVMLDSKDGFYFNTKFEPKCGEGDVVGIEYEQKKETSGNIKKLTVLEKNSDGFQAEPEPKPQAGYKASGNRQDSIIWQHSQEMAIKLAELIVSKEGFALKGKADAKRVQLEELVDELTCRLFKDASDPLVSSAYKTNAGIEADSEDFEEGDEKDSEQSSGDWDDEWTD